MHVMLINCDDETIYNNNISYLCHIGIANHLSHTIPVSNGRKSKIILIKRAWYHMSLLDIRFHVSCKELCFDFHIKQKLNNDFLVL